MDILGQYGYRFDRDGLRKHLARQGHEMTETSCGIYKAIADHMVVAYDLGRQGRELADYCLFIARVPHTGEAEE